MIARIGIFVFEDDALEEMENLLSRYIKAQKLLEERK
ncbi:MAG: hypothetical protein K0S93_81 [Nitrososphaeraceae archaeon]|jgi:hypothetical protein|nr:hypothetical protein [Nitrososphaeraceae archaeon]